MAISKCESIHKDISGNKQALFIASYIDNNEIKDTYKTIMQNWLSQQTSELDRKCSWNSQVV